jgi:adenine C2-methylase RlmN of 23S rRNA A2503 and tRNA A37
MKTLRIKPLSQNTFYTHYEVDRMAQLDTPGTMRSWNREMVVPINKIGDIKQVIFETVEYTSETRRKIQLDVVYDVVDYDDICKLLVLKVEE